MSFPKINIISILCMAILFSIAFSLRLGAVNDTVINSAIKGDAIDYYFYAINLKNHQIFSRQKGLKGNKAWPMNSTPESDAVRSPGYPFFLMNLVEWPPSKPMFWKISFFQALLDSFCVILAFNIYRQFMGMHWAFIAGGLVAISPHLISVTTYILTETLFTFLLVLSLWLVLNLYSKKSIIWALTAGVVIALATLTRPTLQYFFIPLGILLVYQTGWKTGFRLVTPLFLGFLIVFGAWTIRNISVTNQVSDPQLMINALHHGMYPDFTYKNITSSKGYPYRADPNSKEISKNINSILSEIYRRFREEPMRHIRWYLFGKPKNLLSWDILAGMGDIFIYPVKKSPYFDQAFFQYTYAFMKVVHWPIVILAAIGSIVIWLPGFTHKIPESRVFAARLFSLVLIYFIALHIIVAPFPRYGIPLRAVLFGMATFICSHITVMGISYIRKWSKT